MRSFIRGSALIILAGMLVGCGESKQTACEAPPAAKAVAVNACVMQAGSAKVLQVTPAANFKCEAADGSLKVTGPSREVNIWLVSDAKTVDAGVAEVPKQIVSEFKDFKAEKTTDLTIAGNPAKRLTGPGHEADDGDAGAADVIVFKVGDHVFVACTHGENLAAMDHQSLLNVVQTAQAP